MSFSVFLPLGLPVQQGESDHSTVSVFLHRYFFPDPSRNHVEGLDRKGKLPAIGNSNEFELDIDKCNKSELEYYWNIELLENGVLPLFLPALADFAKKWETEGKIQKLEQLTHELGKHKFWKQTHEESQKQRFNEWNWICRYCVDDNGKPINRPVEYAYTQEEADFYKTLTDFIEEGKLYAFR